MSSIDPSLAFKQVAHSIKNNPNNHLYLTGSLGTSTNKNDAISFNELRKIFVELHNSHKLTFKQANRLQKSFRIIHQNFKQCRKENLIKKIVRLWITYKCSQAMKKVPTPLTYFKKYQFFAGSYKVKYLAKIEAESIYFYTTSFYSDINKLLRAITVPHEELTFVAKAMARGLEKLPKTEEKIYRGISFSKPVLSLKVGDTFSDQSFMSFSTNKNVALRFLNFNPQKFLFKVKKSKNAKDISAISEHPYEKEYLYAPNQKFKIVNIKQKTLQKHSHTIQYSRVILEEV